MHKRSRLKQEPEPIEFLCGVVSKRAKNASQFCFSFFLGDCFRLQAALHLSQGLWPSQVGPIKRRFIQVVNEQRWPKALARARQIYREMGNLEMVATLLLQRKAGVRSELPEWLTAGFGRATSYRATTGQKFVADDRKLQRLLLKKRNAADVWDGKLEADEAEVMQASVAEMVGYGIGTARLTKLLEGFKPGENVEVKTTAQAMEAANLTADQLNKHWKKFVK